MQEFGFDADSGWLESLTLDVNGDGDVDDDDEVQFTYGRDQLGRIVREEVSNSSYIYKPLSGDDLVKYVSNPINQYKSVGGDKPTYDAGGNLTYDGTYSYDWDEENFLTKVRAGKTTEIVAEYEYDALGRRSEKEVTDGSATTRYLWGGATNYAVYSGGNILQRVYVYGPGIDEPLMVKEYDGVTETFDDPQYIHRDGKNTVIAVTNGGVGNASVTNKFTMDAWGNDTDSDVSPFKFTSRRLDKETGNFYYRNRYYDPDTGRFMSNDPIGYGDGLNMYAYVGNDPVNYSDPFGLTRWDGEDNGEDDVDEEIHVIGNRIYLPAGGGGIVAAGGGGGGRITGAPREDGMVATGSDQVVPIACNQGGLAGCFVITAQRIVQNVTSGGYVNIGCRGCPQTRAMTNGWQQEDPTSYLNGAGARAAEARMLLGYGRAQAQNITDAVNRAALMSVTLPLSMLGGSGLLSVGASRYALGSYIGSNLGFYEGVGGGDSVGGVAIRTFGGGISGLYGTALAPARLTFSSGAAAFTQNFGNGLVIEASVSLSQNDGNFPGVLRGAFVEGVLGMEPWRLLRLGL